MHPNTDDLKNENEVLTKESPGPFDPSASTLNLFHQFSEKTSPLSENRYTLLKELGEGGMGVVQLVRDEILGREVALKKIHLNTRHIRKKEKQLLWRLQREAEIMAILEHPNIVPLYEIQIAKEQELQFTMKKVEGQTLRQLLEAHHDPNSSKERYFLEILLKVCDGIRYAHAKGVIHRDLKPENIMVGNYGEVYILDWGIAKKLEETVSTASLKDLQISPECQTIGGIGTLGYMPPEQQRSATNVNERADIYSLGKILRECYTKLSPWKELKSLQNYLQEIQNKKNSTSRSFQEELEIKIPREIQSIIKKATEKQPADRYPSIETFALDLTNYLQDIPVSAKEYRLDELLRKWSKRHRKSLTLLSLFFFLLLNLWGFSKWKNHQNYLHAVKESNKTQTLAKNFKGTQGRESRDKIMRLLLQSLVSLNKAFTYKTGKYEEEASKVQIVEKILPLCYEEEDYQLASFIVDDLQSLVNFPEKKVEYSLQVQEKKLELLTQHIADLKEWETKYKTYKVQEGERDNFIFEVSKMREEEVLQQLLTWLKEGVEIFVQEKKGSPVEKQFYQDVVKVLGRLGDKKANDSLKNALQTLWNHLKVLEIPIEPKTLADLEKCKFPDFLQERLQPLLEMNTKNLKQQFYLRLKENHHWEYINEKNEIIFILNFYSIENTLSIYNFNKKQDLEYRQLLKEIIDSLCILKDSASFEFIFDINWDSTILLEKEASLKKLSKTISLESPLFSTNPILKKKILLSQNNFEGLILHFTQALQSNPRNVSFYLSRGNAKRESKDLTGALADFNEAIRLNSQTANPYHNQGIIRNAELYHNRGIVKRDQGDLEGALLDMNESIRLNPQNSKYYKNRGLIKYNKKDLEGALADFTEAIRLNPQLYEAYNNRGVIKSDKGMLTDAILDYDQAILLNPRYTDSYSNRGTAKMNKGDLEGALADMNEAIRLNPQFIKAYYNRGTAKLNKEDLNGALADYDEAIRLNPQFIDAYYNRGVIYYTKRDLENSISNFNQAIQLNPKYTEAYIKRGFVKYFQENPKEAINDFNQAIQLNPQSTEAYIYRGRSKNDLGDYTGALADFSEAILLDPNSLEAYYRRGILKNDQNDFNGALLDLNEAIRLKPEYAKAYYERATAKYFQRDLEGAILDLNKAIRLDPQDAQAYYNRGNVKRDQSDFENALADFTQAILIDPQYGKAYQLRGLTHKNKGNLTEAIQDLEKGLQLEPDAKFQKTLIDLLKQQSREQFTKKDWKNAKETLLKLKKYLSPEDPQHKQIDQKIQQVETLLIPEKK